MAQKEIGPDDRIPDGISFDSENPKYRQFKCGDSVLEYTLEGNEISVDWVCGRNASSMMHSILAADGTHVTRISGYVSDRLGRASNAALRRFGDRVATELGEGWQVTIEVIEGRRYLVFTR